MLRTSRPHQVVEQRHTLHAGLQRRVQSLQLCTFASVGLRQVGLDLRELGIEGTQRRGVLAAALDALVDVVPEQHDRAQRHHDEAEW